MSAPALEQVDDVFSQRQLSHLWFLAEHVVSRLANFCSRLTSLWQFLPVWILVERVGTQLKVDLGRRNPILAQPQFHGLLEKLWSMFVEPTPFCK